jgi:hypothetical protein
MYGLFRPGISQIRLENQWGLPGEIVGTITYDPTDERFMLVDIDAATAPQNTLPPVDSVIDPLLSGPGAGLPAATAGQRYLILNDIGSYEEPTSTVAWGSLIAYANDIIEYNGSEWFVSYDSTTGVNIQYVTNITTNLQYLWTGSTDGKQWVKSYDGLYPGGDWSIVL